MRARVADPAAQPAWMSGIPDVNERSQMSICFRVRAIVPRLTQDDYNGFICICRHPTTDFSLHDAPLVWAAAEPAVSAVVLPTLKALFFGDARCAGVDLAINDLFYVRYDATTAGAQRALER